MNKKSVKNLCTKKHKIIKIILTFIIITAHITLLLLSATAVKAQITSPQTTPKTSQDAKNQQAQDIKNQQTAQITAAETNAKLEKEKVDVRFREEQNKVLKTFLDKNAELETQKNEAINAAAENYLQGFSDKAKTDLKNSAEYKKYMEDEKKRIENEYNKKKDELLKQKDSDVAALTAKSDAEKQKIDQALAAKKADIQKQTDFQRAVDLDKETFNVGLLLKANNQKTFFEKAASSGRPVVIEIIDQVTTFLLRLIIPLSILALIIGGYYMMFAQGEEGMLNTGKSILKNTALGLVFIFASYLIVQFVISIFYQ